MSHLTPELLTALIAGAVSLVGAVSAAVVAILKARAADGFAAEAANHALVAQSHAEAALKP